MASPGAWDWIGQIDGCMAEVEQAGIRRRAAVAIMKRVVSSALRTIVLGIVRVVYRLHVEGRAALPEAGGVLLTPNHITYVDALIVSAASPRPVRFMMSRTWYEKPLVRPWVRVFHCIPVSPTRAKEAIGSAVAALEAGDVVCIFPEGDLTRSGELQELQRGYQLIAKKAGVPVVALRMEGLWGSAFSRAAGARWKNALATVVRGVRVEFGQAIPAAEADPERLAGFLEGGGAG